MSHAIIVHQTGGPDVLSYEPFDPGRPGPGEVLIAQKAIGLNFIDVYFRTGLYAAKSLPFVPGCEGAGEVIAVGEGVGGLQPGDRVAYGTGQGAYAETLRIAADTVVKLPDGIGYDVAAAMMLKGMTAEFLLNRTFAVKPGSVVLFHAAAGGVGLIAGQWAKALGATVIGTAGSRDKVELALANGYDHVINYREQDFVAEVARITGGVKCDVVYDSVGKDTYMGSLDCLKPRGLLACFGQSSGSIPPLNLGILAQKGALYVTRPTLFVYNAARADLEASAARLFDIVQSGKVRIAINQRYPLREAARAHADLEARRTTGTTILVP
ncbi:MAG: quinone oxidoreductase [Rhizobiaceae bacterium]